MNRLFIYRLWTHSRRAGSVIIIFLCCYAIVFYKKMDMLVFPYNDMFSHRQTGKYAASTYAVKINGNLLKITDKLYWKKDFLEESLHNYNLYKQNGNHLFLDKYLDTKISNSSSDNFFLNQLTPDSASADKWLTWYIHFAGNSFPSHGSFIELMQYNFVYENNMAILKDSFVVYKTNFL